MDIKPIVDSYRREDTRDLIDKIGRICKAQCGKWDMGIDDSTKELTQMLIYEYSTSLEKVTGGKLSAEFVIKKLTENMGVLRYGDFKRRVDDHIKYDNLSVTSKEYKLATRVHRKFGAHQVTYNDETGRPQFSVVLFDDKQTMKTRDGVRHNLHGIDLSDLDGIRHTMFHEWTHILEKSFVKASSLKKEDIIYQDGDSTYINACVSPDLSMEEYKAFIGSVDDILASHQEVLFGGISTIEINEKKSPTRRIMHNQISEGATEYIALLVMDTLGLEVKDKDRYLEQRKMVEKVFTSIGKEKAITDYLTSSNKLITLMQSRRFEGKNMLHAADSFVTRLGKTESFFHSRSTKSGKPKEEFDAIKGKIMEFWKLGKIPSEEDVDEFFTDVKEHIVFSNDVSEQLGRVYIRKALRYPSDMLKFRKALDREFPGIEPLKTTDDSESEYGD